VRRALGYSQWSLIGGSYGTRLAMEYVRKYEAHTRAVILDSPVTPASFSPERFGQYAEKALDGVIEECERTAECSRAFPRLRAESKQVFDQVARAPVTATTAHPVGRVRGTVTLTRDHVAEAVRYLLYSSAGASRVPLYLHRAAAGDYQPLADFLIRRRSTGSFDGLYLSITCAEDVPHLAPDAASFDEQTFLGTYRVRQQREACNVWPRGLQPAANRTPVSSAVPVLITSGGLDPVTPPDHARQLMRTLSNGLHINVPSAGHSPSGLEGLDCLAAIKKDFIERGQVGGLDASCVSRIRRPGFALPE
jgi:pimeloyl-ACP methyl ester carboxylesterase